MLKIILVAVVVVIGAVLVFAATRPNTFVVTRTAVIDAPPEALEAMVSDFHQWSAWSPWEKMDPTMKRTYEGPAKGVGAAYAWVGNDKVGAGRMEIQTVTPGREVGFSLHFIKPFEANNAGRFTFEPQGAGAKVTWSMTGKNPFIAKVMGLIFDMDKMIGKDFEAGLANMKAAAEKKA
ncbi:SRPBCC family protein [uncultured Caulobacter sp.]|uniref:SRPBCC family protein n=1 Tax=uncultured Caulobacter sp. TaxID=158749 RepID=UPI00262EDA54|nr:SRPBCC family protein [uncultured Caulobacter sp.]